MSLAKRNANGEGTVYPRKNKQGKISSYRGAYWVNTPEGQKRRYVSGRTRQEAVKKLRKILHNIDEGLIFDAGSLTLEEFLNQWLKNSVEGSVRQSTHQRYTSVVSCHLVPTLGHLKLKNLTPAHVQQLYRDRLDCGLSSSSVRKIHNVLHRALSQAVKWGLIPQNVTQATDPPKERYKEVDPLSSEEAVRFLDTIRGEPLEALYVLAVHTGMRQGELLALKWEDIDLKRGLIFIRRTLTRDRGKLRFGEPKSKKGRRRIDLTSKSIRALEDHWSRQLKAFEKLHGLHKDRGLVFATATGAPVNPSNLRQRSFHCLLDKAGLRKIRFHDLRHTCATLLLIKEAHPKDVQELLGHANIGITLDRYSHFIPGMGRRTAQAMEEIFS